MPKVDPYDELPYRSLPIEWTAPERLALTSLLHGGPRVRLERYRVLDLGCGDGANLIPLAYYRPEAQFVGVDGSESAIATGRARSRELGLTNLEFVHADFRGAGPSLAGQFEFILAHGVFSWIPDMARDCLLSLCTQRLAPGGLVYLNYNTLPGWNVRGMVRRFLLAHTERAGPLGAQAEHARDIAVKVASSLAASPEHPYARLLEREFHFVAQGHPSYIAHEFLAVDNRAYWRSEFLALAAAHQLTYVADADFNYPSGRVEPGLENRIANELGLRATEDDADFLSYRQLHSPILTKAGWQVRRAERDEFARLFIASPLVPAGVSSTGARLFRHPTGFEVEARQTPLATALDELAPLWPRGVAVSRLLGDQDYDDDLTLLHRHGLLELRVGERAHVRPSEPLNQYEARWTGHLTTPYHTISSTKGAL